ncbi:MAG: hypothetical protein FRX49_07943 [Trebouxia sp. A1-2]|nr:MAG: hypothetical protein FRX49_07943 [Trebouxia sp. A1-2]
MDESSTDDHNTANVSRGTMKGAMMLIVSRRHASSLPHSKVISLKDEGCHLGLAVVRGLRVRGSTIWLASSSSTTSKKCPSSTGSPAEQQHQQGVACMTRGQAEQALFQKILGHFHAPCWPNAQDAYYCHDVLCSDTLQVQLPQLAHHRARVLRLQGATAALHGNALVALGFWNFDFHLHGCCATAGFCASVLC